MRRFGISPTTRRLIETVFRRLDYRALGRIYCDEGGRAFWRDRRGPAIRFGLKIATALGARLSTGGRSLYVGAGVSEIPPILMERHDRGRTVAAYNRRAAEVRLLNRAGHAAGLHVRAAAAERATGRFDHLWIVSVLNDPECFPQVSALTYGRADPRRFDAAAFRREQRAIRRLADRCLRRLTLPALVTTSVEEFGWIREWAVRHGIESVVEAGEYRTALVGDPVCFMRLSRTP